MAAGQYPTRPNVLHPGEPQGPPHLVLIDHVPQWPSTVVKEFKDGGASIGLSNSNAVYRWEFQYDGLSMDESLLAMLDAHYAAAEGQFGGFTFRHPRTNVLYQDVHYELYEESPTHSSVGAIARHVILIKRPTG